MDSVERDLLQAIDAQNAIEDTGDYATSKQLDHNALVGTLKSLWGVHMITMEDIDHHKYVLTDEARTYLANGSPEAQVHAAVPPEGIPQPSLREAVGEAVFDIGFKQAMAHKWLGMDKSSGEPRVVRKVEAVEDRTQQALQQIDQGVELAAADVEALRKRNLVKKETWKTYKVGKGPEFALERKRLATDLTHEMLMQGTWRTEEFKPLNFNALGKPTTGGHLNPLLKVRAAYRKIFTNLGFSEMPTNNYVESSFWNFDVLFQPQQHPARDAHDTFFLTKPATTTSFPEDYLQRVKDVHERGGYGSVGYGYNWKRAEAEKNVLRTHTTAVSSRMLYKLAQEGFRPMKLFSIDRVFRNEAIDKTHLAEFHQVEGVVCDKGLTLGDLIGTLELFFQRLGLKQLRFKPAYNPYTEPSMEIFSYSEQLGKWIEVGNSGVFRPEMLQPMGLPEDVTVIAWGLSLERPTMILYGIDNIRELFGHKISLQGVQSNPICRLGL